MRTLLVTTDDPATRSTGAGGFRGGADASRHTGEGAAPGFQWPNARRRSIAGTGAAWLPPDLGDALAAKPPLWRSAPETTWGGGQPFARTYRSTRALQWVALCKRAGEKAAEPLNFYFRSIAWIDT